uniref:Uncharacterized protein n=1 Tax=Lepeophtheirus salmonis TaxID=72036 RepID=A0A0K2U0Y6_LEPSM
MFEFNSWKEGGNHKLWIRQAELPKTLLKISKMTRQSQRACKVYDQLIELDRKKEDCSYKVLRTAFSLSPFVAFDELMIKHWSPGGSIEVYLAYIKTSSNWRDCRSRPALYR